MGKRSNFDRIEKDFYRTIDPRAVEALLSHLPEYTWFYEPCSGEEDLINQLTFYNHYCTGSSDIELDARSTVYNSTADIFITNPPWSRQILHPIIENLSNQKPTWLLFDSDWCHTKQSVPYLNRLQTIVSVGRLKWIPDTKMSSKDNCSWYLFDKNKEGPTTFYGRA